MQCGRQKLSYCWWLRPCTREVLCDSGRFLYGSHQTRPSQDRPDQDQIRPGQDQTRPGQATPDQTWKGSSSVCVSICTHAHTQSGRAHASCFHQVAPSFSFFGSMSRWRAGVLTASASVDVDQFAGKRWRALQVPPAAEAADDLDR